MTMNKKYILIATFLLGLFSCDEGFEALNKNPVAPTEVTYESLFNGLVNSLRLGWNRQLFIHNEILYDITEQGVVTAQTFGNVDTGVEDIWSNYYLALKNARQLKANLDKLTAEDPEAAAVVNAQIDILMAYKTFQLLDFFGDIPYSEAGQAFIEGGVVRPRYDDAKTVYLSLLDELRAASDLLINLPAKTEAGNNFLRVSATYDALFGDNLGYWAQFSNSMLLKYLVRIYDQEPAIAGAGVANLLENGYDFITPGAEVVMSPADQGWNNEGVNWSFREHNKLRLGTTMWNYMTENDEIIDPRLRIFFETNNADEWVPFPQLPDANTLQSGGEPYQKDIRDNSYDSKGEGNIYASFNFYLIRDEQDIPEILMTAAEVKFILAEVFLKGIGTPKDDAIASFRHQEGMLASMEFWQNLVLNSRIWENQPPIFSTGEMFAVTENPRYKLVFGGDETENLAKVYAQRWVDYFRQPWEAFTLLRQTDLLPREKPSNEFFRFQYPISETAYNFDNWSEQAAKMGGDETNVKLWWMD
jgi:hypothetical protein